jgi:hypothetical protein
MPPAAKFDLTATTLRGDTYSDFGAPVHTERGSHGGTIRGANGGPTVGLQTDRGMVTVRKALVTDKPFAPDVEAPAAPPAPPKAPKALQKIEQ